MGVVNNDFQKSHHQWATGGGEGPLEEDHSHGIVTGLPLHEDVNFQCDFMKRSNNKKALSSSTQTGVIFGVESSPLKPRSAMRLENFRWRIWHDENFQNHPKQRVLNLLLLPTKIIGTSLDNQNICLYCHAFNPTPGSKSHFWNAVHRVIGSFVMLNYFFIRPGQYNNNNNYNLYFHK